MLRAITVVMEIVAHGLWATSAAILAKRSSSAWASAFGLDGRSGGPRSPMCWRSGRQSRLACGFGLRAALIQGRLTVRSRSTFHWRCALPLYPAGHSLIVFLLVFGIATILNASIVFELLGWLMHVLIDIPTDSFSYYAASCGRSRTSALTALHGGRPGSGRAPMEPSRLSTFCYGREAGYRLSRRPRQSKLYAGSAIWSKPWVFRAVISAQTNGAPHCLDAPFSR